MNSSSFVSKFSFVLILAVVGALFIPAALSARGDSPFESHMKIINKNFKAIKAAVASGKTDAVKAAAAVIAAEIVQVKNFEPPKAKDRKAELPPLADKTAEAAKALAESSGEDMKAKFEALGTSCAACHEIFQPKT